MLIRPIEQKDVERLIELVQRMLEEGSSHKNVPFDAPVIRGWLYAAIEKSDDFFCMVAEQNGEVIGGMLGCKVQYTFSFAQKASELGLYIAKEHRGRFAAPRLIKAFEKWARDQGCVSVHVGVTVGINNDCATGIYKRMGFHTQGPLLCKELDYGKGS